MSNPDKPQNHCSENLKFMDQHIKQNENIIKSTINVPGGFYRKVIIVFLLWLLPVFGLLTLFIGTLSYLDSHAEKKLIKYREINKISLTKKVADVDIKDIVADLKVLAHSTGLRDLLKSPDSNKVKKRFEEFLLAFCENKNIYDQIRFINEKGMEVVRVNFNMGTPAVIPQHMLQNKADRYYFKDTIKLQEEEIFISPLDLNIEQGKVEQPLKPMIRFGMPIVDDSRQRRGIVILNYFGEKLINHLVDFYGSSSSGQMMLLNKDGYWLKGAKVEDEWGFMFEPRKERTFFNLYPKASQNIFKRESGQFVNEDGLFTFATVHPLLEGAISSSGSGKAFDSSDSQLTYKDYEWKIVSFIHKDMLQQKTSSVAVKWYILITVNSLIVIVILWYLALSQVKRKQTEKERIKLIEELKENLAKVKALSGMLPICSSCKKVRDDKGYWNQIELYIQDHSEAEFTHGICPECTKKLYFELYDDELDQTLG